MFDVTTLSKRYFGLRLTVEADDGKRDIDLEIEPPKLKTMKRLMALSKSGEDENQIDMLTDAMQKLLSKNKSGYKVPRELIEELNFDELQAILEAFLSWIAEVQNLKKLNVPYYPAEGDAGHFDIQTLPEKLVSEYTRFNLREVDELNYLFLPLFTRCGNLPLYANREGAGIPGKKCWAIRQTEPDRGALRAQFGNQKANGG